MTKECVQEARKKAAEVEASLLIPRYDKQNLNIKTHMVNSQLVDAYSAEEDVFTDDNNVLNTSKEEAGKYFVLDRQLQNVKT